MTKVIVGMSGGVDSAVAALLLKKSGYDVIGVTLRTWLADDGTEGRCCEIDEAHEAARSIGIPFHAVNCLSDFSEYVIRPFVDDYINGLTPNPCIGCNKNIKWERLLRLAKSLDVDFVATGHYAFVDRLENGRFTVRQARSLQKDQTYMLWQLTQDQLAHTLMPLGSYTKDEVRSIAEEAGIPVAGKPDSQEICFIPDGNYSEFIRSNAPDRIPPEGNFVDESGKVLGRHRGIIHYTVGQRRGLGFAAGYPVYVKQIRPLTNEVVIGEEDSLYTKELYCDTLNFLSIPDLPEGETLQARVKIRYHHEGAAAAMERIDGSGLRITFETPVRAVTPGQSAVFYDEENRLIGGGIIRNTL